MLARRGKITLPDGGIIETPLLLPSFSSRGFPDIKEIMKGLSEVIRGPALVSAYDIRHELILKNFSLEAFNKNLENCPYLYYFIKKDILEVMVSTTLLFLFYSSSMLSP